MRCKLNDLVMVVRSELDNAGRIGRIVGRATPGTRMPWGGRAQHGDDWLVEGRFTVADEFFLSCGEHHLATWDGNHRQESLISMPDSWLRPIRDGGGTDETLAWAGKPLAEPVNAP